ncbi:MAG: tRNA (adenosine(37)-N6)-dimethylallyltransferase MiaA [Acidobacteriota bacterium]
MTSSVEGGAERPGCGSAIGPPILVVVGPTGVGKSEFALRACRRFDGEVISVDSMQVYRGLDRGTAKPDRAARRTIPHHGIDLAGPERDFSLGDFVRAAERALEQVRGRGRLPVIVGGTGLYLRGLLKGIVDAPRRDEAIRARLRRIERRRGSGFLHRMLSRVDPQAAERLAPRDGQRLVRALEVFFRARRGLSDLIRESPFGPDRYATVKIGLSMDRRALYRRLDERVVCFFRSGLVREVRGILAAGCPPTSNALKALGYREVMMHLRGEIGIQAAIALTQRHTRRYAKRQWTWFRREEGVVWFDVDPGRDDRFREPLEHAARALGRGRAR